MQWGDCCAWSAVGGALGSLARYLVAGAVQPAWWPGFPCGIFVVNITGGLVMGLIAELAALKLNLTPEMRAFLTTGILGGYTTFSTFSLDSALLMRARRLCPGGAPMSSARWCCRSWRCSPACGSCARSMPELRTIDADDDGIRLDRWFKRHYPALTHVLLEKLLRKGEVRLDGKRAKCRRPRRRGPGAAPAAAGDP